MKFFLILFLFISGCSFLPTTDSEYWTEDNIKMRDIKIDYKKKLPSILEKSDDIRTMTLKEYEIYIDAHIKKSKYPSLSK
tara:strand:+ start:335 stop:574 length:240 start_codon:yes stop_codon:yes gene_type:complete